MNDPFVGTVLQDRYRIHRLLGEGGMGAVYEAENVKIGRRVAIKVLHRQYARDPEVVARFHREAKAATAIGHPHIIEVLDLGELPDGASFMVLELLKGHDWSDELESGRQQLARVASVLVQVCDALQAAHDKGIVHRDLKPENIFLIERHGRDDFVKVLDFGISKMQPTQEEAQQLTGTQMILGTASYMSPEQVTSTKDVDHRSDLYTIGVILFRALAGRFPLEAESLPMLLMHICSARRPSLGELRPDLPAEVIELCDRLISIQPGERPQSAREIAEVLSPWTKASATPPRSHAGATVSLADSAASMTPASTGAATGPLTPASPEPAPQRSRALVIGGLAIGLLVVASAAMAGYSLLPSQAPAPVAVVERDAGVEAGVEAAVDAGAAQVAIAAGEEPAPSCQEGAVLIGAGSVSLGEETEEVASLCLGRTEVTAGEFAGCVERAECPAPAASVNTEGLRAHELGFWNGLCTFGNPARAEHPMNCIDWFGAQSFCRAAGGRLPSRAEWQLAAGEGRYPWGDAAPDSARSNVCGPECAAFAAANRQGEWQTLFEDDDGFAGTAPVGRFALGATRDGVLDLGGNVWEWTSTALRGEDVLRVNLGGGFATTEEVNVRVGAVNVLPPTARDASVGFRCAFDPRESPSS